jgi:hypothetical protein
LADTAGGIFALAGEDGDVFEAAEGAKDHLAEEGEREHVELRELERQEFVMDWMVARGGPERKQNKCGVDDEDRDAAYVVNPSAEFEATKGCSADSDRDGGDDGERGEVIFGQPRCGRADEVGEFGRNGVQNGGGDGDAVEPEVPCGHEAAEVAKGRAGPDVEASFKRHLTVEIDDADRHGKVEDHHGGDPGEGLCSAEPGGDAYPRATDHAKDLRENEVSQAKPAVKAGLWSRRSCGHVLGMVAQEGGGR